MCESPLKLSQPIDEPCCRIPLAGQRAGSLSVEELSRYQETQREQELHAAQRSSLRRCRKHARNRRRNRREFANCPVLRCGPLFRND